MDEVWIRVLVIICGAVFGSTGLWAYMQHKDTQRKATTKLMMGLAYAQLVELGMKYINRGTITKDEFEDYQKYFYTPYKELGGNGVAERIMADVSHLPFAPPYSDLVQIRTRDGEHIDNVPVVRRREEEAHARRP